MLRNSNSQNIARPRSKDSDPATLPDEGTLKRVAEIVLRLESSTGGRGKVTISSVNNISGTNHPSMRNATVMNFSAVVGEPASASSGQDQPLSIIVKKVEESESNELQAYTTLFKDLQSGRGSISSLTMNIYSAPPSQSQLGKLYNLIPRAYHIERPYLFLENLESPPANFRNIQGGGGTVDPLNLDFNHCLLAVETLARFHASSYLLRRQLGEKGKGKLEMLRKYPFLNQQTSSIYSSRQSPKLSPIFEKAFELACKLVESQNSSLAFKLQRKLLDPSGIFEKIVKLVEEEKYENDDFYLVSHGSFLLENMLFNYDKGGNEPAECRLTNLGSLYMGPLASDLALFLLTSTTLGFRQEFEEKLLAFYCDAFQEQVISSARLGGNAEIATEFEENIDEFHRKVEKQYKKMLEFGFYHSLVLLPVIAYRRFTVVNNNNCQVRCSSISDLLLNYGNCFVGGGDEAGRKKFEEFAVNEPWLGERFVEILKQLAKSRVLL